MGVKLITYTTTIDTRILLGGTGYDNIKSLEEFGLIEAYTR